jgi:hypothetical protein
MVTPDKNNTDNCTKGISKEGLNDLDSTLCVGNTSSANNGTIPISLLLQYHTAGIRKLVPLNQDSQTANVYDSLITQEELNQYKEAEGKPVRIIHKKPNFWTEARLIAEQLRFHNVASTFGITDLYDSKGRTLYLYGVDVDTEAAYERLKHLIEELKLKTIVVKSYKPHGYHFYILTPAKHESLNGLYFKLGLEIEIKADMSLGTMTLPTSVHRKYQSYVYQHLGLTDKVLIDEDDSVYKKIMQLMSDCIRSRLNSEAADKSAEAQLQKEQVVLRSFKPLNDEQTAKTCEYIVTKTNSYIEHTRNDFVYGLSGHCFHNGISQLSTINLVARICSSANDPEKK